MCKNTRYRDTTNAIVLDYMTKILSKHDCDGGDDHYVADDDGDNDNGEYDDSDDDSDD